MKILLVEDDPRLSRSLARLLEQDRHNVEVAPDGETGLDIALGENGIDVVILDIGLPDISGLDVARRIREERRSSRS
jgi:DNA-binding response OmpR family regulator